MQLRRLWVDRTDLLRASLPPTPHGHPRPPRRRIIWTAGVLKILGRDIWMTRDFRVYPARVSESSEPWMWASFLSCAPPSTSDFVRRRQFVLQVRGEAAWGQMAALAIQRTDNFLHTFLQVCGVVICSEAMRADLVPVICVVIGASLCVMDEYASRVWSVW